MTIRTSEKTREQEEEIPEKILRGSSIGAEQEEKTPEKVLRG